jgi:hypothetical protein
MKAAVSMEIHAACSTSTLGKGIELDKAFPAYDEVLKALEPFALVAEHDIGDGEMDSDWFTVMTTYNEAPRLTVGDFRRALAVIAKATA